MILRIPGRRSSAGAEVNMLSTLYRWPSGYFAITAEYQLVRVVGMYGRAAVARPISGHVPRIASAFAASSSESAKTGEAIAIVGSAGPTSGALREVRICSSTRSSTSPLIERPQLNPSSATSTGYRYRHVPRTAGRRCSRSVNDVTTPKNPGPLPRAAQYRSGGCSGARESVSPPGVTPPSPNTLSHAGPTILLYQPYPP